MDSMSRMRFLPAVYLDALMKKESGKDGNGKILVSMTYLIFIDVINRGSRIAC